MTWTKRHQMIDRRLAKKGIYAGTSKKQIGIYNRAWEIEEKKEKAKRQLAYKKKKRRTPRSSSMNPFGLKW